MVRLVVTGNGQYFGVVLGYDGPLQYAMGRDNNPDQIISVLSSPDEIDGEY